MRTIRWTPMALGAALTVASAGCFDRDDDLERGVVPGAPLERDRDEPRTPYDPPGEAAAERVEERAERVDESAAAERVDESVEPEVDEGLDPQIDEHFDSRLRRP